MCIGVKLLTEQNVFKFTSKTWEIVTTRTPEKIKDELDRYNEHEHNASHGFVLFPSSKEIFWEPWLAYQSSLIFSMTFGNSIFDLTAKIFAQKPFITNENCENEVIFGSRQNSQKRT